MTRVNRFTRPMVPFVNGILVFVLITCCHAGQTAQPRPADPFDVDPLYNDVVVERDVVYGHAGDDRLKLDIVRPKKPSEKPRAVIVYIHGGSWRHGDKKQRSRQ